MRSYRIWCLNVCLISALLILTLGCQTTDKDAEPAGGWQGCSESEIPAAVKQDFEAYVKSLTPKEQSLVGPWVAYKDNAGRHAIDFEIPWYGWTGVGTWKEHFIIYDSANKRIKVIKRNAGHFMS
jgi:hypothetical protein